MADGDLAESIEALFAETAKAHHEAFSETDGDDPGWPLWYAENLADQLNELLGTSLSKSELVYLIVLADKEHAEEAAGTDWKKFWTAVFLDRYGE